MVLADLALARGARSSWCHPVCAGYLYRRVQHPTHCSAPALRAVEDEEDALEGPPWRRRRRRPKRSEAPVRRWRRWRWRVRATAGGGGSRDLSAFASKYFVEHRLYRRGIVLHVTAAGRQQQPIGLARPPRPLASAALQLAAACSVHSGPDQFHTIQTGKPLFYFADDVRVTACDSLLQDRQDHTTRRSARTLARALPSAAGPHWAQLGHCVRHRPTGAQTHSRSRTCPCSSWRTALC